MSTLYQKIKDRVREGLDGTLEDAVLQNIDIDCIAEKVLSRLNMDRIAQEFSQSIADDIAIDIAEDLESELAEEIGMDFDVSEMLHKETGVFF